jgi:hypothetical protein
VCFSEFWHNSQGNRTDIYCTDLCCSLAHFLRWSYNEREHRYQGDDLCICIGNSVMNFEEFGSDF